MTEKSLSIASKKLKLIFNMNNYIEQLETNLFDLVKILTDQSMWNFLSEHERMCVGKVLQSSQEAKEKFEKTC